MCTYLVYVYYVWGPVYLPNDGWCCCDVGRCIWLLITNMLLRLFVNICVSV